MGVGVVGGDGDPGGLRVDPRPVGGAVPVVGRQRSARAVDGAARGRGAPRRGPGGGGAHVDRGAGPEPGSAGRQVGRGSGGPVPGGPALHRHRAAQAGGVGERVGVAASGGRGGEGPDPGPAEVHEQGLHEGLVLAGPREAGCAQGAVRLLPGGGAVGGWQPGDRLGRLGPRGAGAGAGPVDRGAGQRRGLGRGPGDPAAGRAWRSWSRGCSSGTTSRCRDSRRAQRRRSADCWTSGWPGSG